MVSNVTSFCTGHSGMDVNTTILAVELKTLETVFLDLEGASGVEAHCYSAGITY
jgi:hypothetical protein